MTFNPDRHPVPDHYTTSRFHVTRQLESHNTADYEAVMQSRLKLRCWSDSEWPEDDFTLEQNLADLKMHIGEHQRDEAYGFSIFDAAENSFIGSLYLNPINGIVEAYQDDPLAESVLRKFDACADYWLREGTPPDMEVAFAKAVQEWLRDAWWFRSVAFGSRKGMDIQRQCYAEAELQEFAVLTNASGTRRFHLHAPSAFP